MSFRVPRKKKPSRTLGITILLSLIMITITGCVATLPKPSGSESALLIVSIEIERNLGTNNPDTVLITRKSDGKDYEFSSRDGKYYYFANLPAGAYKIKTASLSIRSGGSSTTYGNLTTTFSSRAINAFPFSPEIIAASSARLQPGKVAFMGSIVAEGTSKFFPPGAVEISNVKISNTSQDRKIAFDHFKNEFKDSPWVNYIN